MMKKLIGGGLAALALGLGACSSQSSEPAVPVIVAQMQAS